jgi:plastocyanin
MRKTTLSIAVCVLTALTSTSIFAGTLSVSVLDKEGKPAPDAVVVLIPTGKGNPKNALPMQATVAQEKMQFIPAVSVVAKGAKVRFVNNDAWDHHVRATPAGMAQLSAGASNGLELRLEGKTDGKPAKSAELSMDKAGANSAMLLGCFMHGSMRGHVYVSESPWALKTAADGMATFDDVPEGAVQIKVWHADQLIDLPQSQVTLGAAVLKQQVQLQIVPRRKRV